MSIQHCLKIILFGFMGFTFSEYALLLFLMIFAGVLGTFIGRHILFKLPEKQFQLLSKLVISALALRLLWQAIFNNIH